MRIRYLKNTEEILAASSFVVADPAELRGKWRRAPEQRLCLEIGCGKGRFIKEMASRHPDGLWIGDERMSTILARAAGQMDPEADHNVRLIRWDAQELDQVFAEGELSCIYLNFSDPWPKEKHAKRRLTSKRFLPLYARLLNAEGWLSFKTDNDALFAFSLESLKEQGWSIGEMSDDLHHSPYIEGNVMTEYEENFVRAGKNIHYLKAYPPRVMEADES